MSRAPCPVHLKEQVEMPCGIIEDAVAEDVNEVTQGRLHTFHAAVHLLQTTEEVGIRLDDVEVGVLRFREVGVDLRQPDIGKRLPVAREGFDVASVFMVAGVVFDDVEEGETLLKHGFRLFRGGGAEAVMQCPGILTTIVSLMASTREHIEI